MTIMNIKDTSDVKMAPNRSRSFFRKFRDRIATLLNKTFRNRNHVYIFDPDSKEPPGPDGMVLQRYERVDDIPEAIRESIITEIGIKAYEQDLREIRLHSVLWLVLLNDQVVAKLHSRKGEYFMKWFVPLRAGDVVLFRARTYRDFRGRGINPRFQRMIIRKEVATDRNAYVDCKVYNASAIRGIEKAGFRRIATMKPISQKEALGEG
jgi:hypothetical protein